jgi:protein arginine kinase
MIRSILTHKMPPWLSGNGPENDVVLSTRVRLARNLAHYQFPARASLFERAKIFEEAAAAFKAASACSAFNPVLFDQLDKRQRRFLVEERLASAELETAEGGRGIIHDESRRVSVMVNEEDHIRFQGLDAGLRPQELWGMVDGIDDAVAMQLDYAFDNRRGFLTCCPTNAGTGLRVSILVHLPGLVLTHSIDSVLHGAGRMGVAVRGFFGEHSTMAGDLFSLSNAAAMGSTETAFLDNALTVVKHVVEFERKARERLLADAHLQLLDKIHRSWGILCQAQLLGVDEFLTLASALRTGIECNLFDKCTKDELNRLTLFVLPAHVATYYNREMTDNECREARAELVRAFFARKKTGRKVA